MRIGSLEAASYTLSVFSTWVPLASVFDMPFIFRDDAHAFAAYSGAPGQKLAEAFPAAGLPRARLLPRRGAQRVRHFPVLKPEDVKWPQMRTLQSPLHLQIWSSMGANPTPIPAPEIYNALQTKVVEIADNTATNYVNEKVVRGRAALLDHRAHLRAIGAMFLSERWFQRQKPEHQKVLFRRHPP
jgi:TRAP-type C4-dicarboxylate transport system substrate-binding protein